MRLKYEDRLETEKHNMEPNDETKHNFSNEADKDQGVNKGQNTE